MLQYAINYDQGMLQLVDLLSHVVRHATTLNLDKLLVMGGLLVATPQPTPGAADSCLHEQPTKAASVQLDCLRVTQGARLHQGQEAAGSAYTWGMSCAWLATDLCSPGESDDDSLEAA